LIILKQQSAEMLVFNGNISHVDGAHTSIHIENSLTKIKGRVLSSEKISM